MKENNNFMIRAELPGDKAVIHETYLEAFKESGEADLIDKLRETKIYNPEFSLVAIENEQVVGHLVLYPVEIDGNRKQIKILGLGPIAVKPEFQGEGIGSTLINEGIARARKLGYSAITVLGDPKYYKKFGFKKATMKGLKISLDVSQDDFMVLELIRNSLDGLKSTVYYAKGFEEL